MLFMPLLRFLDCFKCALKLSIAAAAIAAVYKWVLNNANISFGIYRFFLIQFEIVLTLCRLIFNKTLDNLFS